MVSLTLTHASFLYLCVLLYFGPFSFFAKEIWSLSYESANLRTLQFEEKTPRGLKERKRVVGFADPSFFSSNSECDLSSLSDIVERTIIAFRVCLDAGNFGNLLSTRGDEPRAGCSAGSASTRIRS